MASVNDTSASLSDRFQGCLLGALIGDCLGAPYESSRRVISQSVIKFLQSKKSQGSVQPQHTVDQASSSAARLRFTDDTAMSRSVAKSLTAENGFDAVDMAHRFASEYKREPHRGYGANVTTVFDAIASGMHDGDIYAPAAAQFGGSGSYGNGGAMRIAPVALFQFLKDETKTKLTRDFPDEICVQSTKLTHSNEAGFGGAFLQCVAIKLALQRGLEQNSVKLDHGQFLATLIETMIDFEGDGDGPPDAKKPKIEGAPAPSSETEDASDVSTSEATSSEDDDDAGSDETPNGISYTRGHDSKASPYAAKLRHVERLLKEVASESSRTEKQKQNDPLCLKPAVKILGNTVAAVGSVPTAVFCFLRAAKEDADERDELKLLYGGCLVSHWTPHADSHLSSSGFTAFEKTIAYAISCGGDTDTIASMAGAMAGAFWGAEGINRGWIEACEGHDVTRQSAVELTQLPP